MDIAQGGAFPIQISTNGVVRIHVKDTGEVGIGTVVPANIFHVYSLTDLSLFERASTSATNDISGSIYCQRTTTQDMVDGFGTRIIFRIKDSAGVNNAIAYIAAYRSGADNSGCMSIWTNNAGSHTEKVTVTPVGNVGIGTTAPLLNVGSAAGDFSGNGLHIKAAADTKAFLILEGFSKYLEGGHGATGLVFCEGAGAADGKMIVFEQDNASSATPNVHIKALHDDLTVHRHIMVLQHAGGNVGIGACAFDASAVNYLAIKNGTQPSAHTDDQIYIGSKDSTFNVTNGYGADGATLSLFLETDLVEPVSDLECTNMFPTWVNGTQVYIMCHIPS